MNEDHAYEAVPLHLGRGARLLLDAGVDVDVEGLALHRRAFNAYAGPNVWGPSVTVANAVGVVTYTIEYAAVGDTLVLGRVTYFKGQGGGKKVQEQFRDSVTITTANAIAPVECEFKGTPFGSAVDGFVTP